MATPIHKVLMLKKNSNRNLNLAPLDMSAWKLKSVLRICDNKQYLMCWLIYIVGSGRGSGKLFSISETNKTKKQQRLIQSDTFFTVKF